MTWLEVNLGQVLSLEYGSALSKRHRNSSGSIPVVGSNGITDTHTKPIVTAPGIVVGRKGSAGKVSWIESDFWPIDTSFYVRPLVPVEVRWLFYVLHFLKLERLAIGDLVPVLIRNDAYQLKISLPTLSEQRKIVEILDQADMLRQKRAEADAKIDRILSVKIIASLDLLTVKRAANANAKLDKLFDLLLQRAFSGELTAKWRQVYKKQLQVEMKEQAKILATNKKKSTKDRYRRASRK